MGNFRYILRFLMEPGHNEEQVTERLLKYCTDAKIDEVMFFINGEEVYQGHLTKEELKPWLDMIIKYRSALQEIGVDTSVNPWTTLSHADRGRQMNSRIEFQTMVDFSGIPSAITGCPLDEKFINYLCDTYAYLASCKPKVIWVEDDFRLHNHKPVEWGCFCPIHMREYSRRIGRKITREEFVSGLLQSEPNEYRKVWMDVAREEMVALAERVGKAVRAAAPETTVGLMSSAPINHSVENRDWYGIIKGLGAGRPAHSRPHLPAYSEVHPLEYLFAFQNIAVETVNLLPEGTEVYPELENCTWTSYSKSDRFAKFQIELCSVLGAKGITLNVFKMNGNGIDITEDFDKSLSEAKDYMSAVSELNLHQNKIEGVVALYSETSASTLIAEKTGHMNQLLPNEALWAGMLPAFGISTKVSNSCEHKGKTVAVAGQYFRNLKKKEIIALFENNFVMLDGEAAATLYDMGLGELAGIKSCSLVKDENGINSYEEICTDRQNAGFTKARASCQMSAKEVLLIDCNEQAERISNIMCYDKTVTAVGMYLYKDCFVYPYLHNRDTFPMALFTNVRREVLAGVAKERGIAVASGAQRLAFYAYDDAFVLANASLDDAENVTVVCPAYVGKNVYEITRSGEKQFVCTVDENGAISLPGKTALLQTRTFTVEKK